MGGTFYLLYPVSLWFQSNVYPTDIPVLPLWIFASSLWIHLLLSQKENKKMSPVVWTLFFISFYLMNFTDYLGICVLASVWIWHSLEWVLNRNAFKNPAFRSHRLKIIGLASGASGAAYATTLLLYGSHLGYENYYAALVQKFLYRSGISQYQGLPSMSEFVFFWGSLIKTHIFTGFLRGYVVALFFLTLLMFLWRKIPARTILFQVVLAGFLAPPLLYISLLHNNSLVHDCSILKLSVPFAIVSGIVYFNLSRLLSSFFKGSKFSISIRFAIYFFFSIVTFTYAAHAFHRYHSSFAAGGYSDLKKAGEFIRGKTAWKKKMIYALSRPRGRTYSFEFPPLVYYMERNIAWVRNVEQVKKDLRRRGVGSGILLVWFPLKAENPNLTLKPILNTRMYYMEIKK